MEKELMKKPYEKPALILDNTDTEADKADPADVAPIITGVAIIASAVFAKYC